MPFDPKKSSVTESWWPLLEKDTAFISQRQDWLSPNRNCPVCRSSRRIHLFRKTNFNYVRCKECDHTYFDHTYSDDAQRWYWSEASAPRHWNNMLENETSYRSNLDIVRGQDILKMVSLYANSSSELNILEIGAGSGNLALQISHQLELLGIPHNYNVFEPQLDSPITRLSNPHITVHPYPFSHENKKFFYDLVIMIEVIEHIQEPEPLVESILSTLKPGGLLYLTTPNTHSLECLLLKSHSDIFGFDHSSLFSKKSLKHLFNHSNWDLVLLSTPGKRDVLILLDALPQVILHLLTLFPIKSSFLQRPLKQLQLIICALGLSSHMKAVIRKRP